MKTTPDNRHIVQWPPVLIEGSGPDCKTYAVSGGTWIEIEPGTTREEIEHLFCWGNEARQYWDPNFSNDKNEWEVQGSKGSMYKVIQNGPTWTCECRGFQFRRDCKHIANLRNANST